MDEEEEQQEENIASADGVCPDCGDPVEDCECEYIESQFGCMQTDDAAVDHSVWTSLGRVLA